MKTVEFSLCYEVNNDSCNAKIAAVIMCAGSSSRMLGVDKQLEKIGGIEVAIRSMLAFQRNENISAIVVAAHKNNMNVLQNLIDKYNVTKVTDIVEGGASREESVQNAVNCLDDSFDFVLVHDGARPLVNQTVINNVINGTVLHNATVCAVGVKDTIKEVSGQSEVVGTVNRSSVVAVQTPQGFSCKILKEALNRANDCLSVFTDDSAVVEHSGQRVFVVPGDYRNIKITTAEDLLIAKTFYEEYSDEYI